MGDKLGTNVRYAYDCYSECRINLHVYIMFCKGLMLLGYIS